MSDLFDIFISNKIPARYVSEVYLQNNSDNDFISDLDNRVNSYLDMEGVDQIVDAEYICSGF